MKAGAQERKMKGTKKVDLQRFFFFYELRINCKILLPPQGKESRWRDKNQRGRLDVFMLVGSLYVYVKMYVYFRAVAS